MAWACGHDLMHASSFQPPYSHNNPINQLSSNLLSKDFQAFMNCGPTFRTFGFPFVITGVLYGGQPKNDKEKIGSMQPSAVVVCPVFARCGTHLMLVIPMHLLVSRKDYMSRGSAQFCVRWL
jgi:hypothetical protein